jgi:hypothetical protein
MNRGGRMLRVDAAAGALLRMLSVAAAAAGALLMLVILAMLVMLAWYRFGPLPDCEPGYTYSIRHLRCVGMLEFDMGGWW